MRMNTVLLCAVALSLGACSSYSMNSTSGPRYTPRADVMQKNYTESDRMADRADIKSYNEYEQREPCQHYRRLPRHYTGSCPSKEVPVVVAEKTLHPVLQSYTILFDFDKSTIRSEENKTLDRIVREITKYHPQEVTVTGYTDSSGNADYNQKLSRERAQAVSRALLDRGIASRVLDRNARGEYDQAVQTADGVKNQKNRRVVVDFRR